jgi:hypothetical protein
MSLVAEDFSVINHRLQYFTVATSQRRDTLTIASCVYHARCATSANGKQFTQTEALLVLLAMVTCAVRPLTSQQAMQVISKHHMGQ